MKARRYCVVGAGAGGLATAAHLSRLGMPPILFNRTPSRIEPVRAWGGIQVEGLWRGLHPVAEATSDPGCVQEADVIIVATPATAHGEVARLLAPHLTSRHVVILHPGRTLGALEFLRVLRAHGVRVRAVGEADTLLYTSRSPEPGRVRVLGLKRRIRLAAVPAWDTRVVVDAFARLGPAEAASSVIETGLSNIGAMVHPAPMVLNAGRIEAGQPFEYYREGMTGAVVSAILGLDRERMATARAWGVRVLPVQRWLRASYEVPADACTLSDLFAANPAYVGVMAPATLAHRYLLEDVPTGLVPLVELARLVGLRAPLMNAIIDMAAGLTGVDFRRTGRTLERLGLGELDARALGRLVLVGEDVPVAKPAGAY